ncbi:MAG TPA: tetratricopeptide repeat protein [Chthonomonadales bacterium]|nr:tetratricopeptide repeat protein [Chthonomonadales bacterium]
MSAQPLTVTLALGTVRDGSAFSVRLRTTVDERTLLSEPFDPVELRAAIDLLDRSALAGQEDGSEPVAIGRMERALRLKSIRAALRDATPPPPGRLRLLVGAADSAVAAVPWELLPVASDVPAGLDATFRVIRLPRRWSSVTPTGPANRCAVLVWSDPASRQHGQLPSVEAEARALLAGGGVPGAGPFEWRELAHATPASLERAINEWRPAVFHFAGHGEGAPSGARLVLESGRPGVEEYVYADDVARWLAAGGVWLAVFCACRSGDANGGFGAACAEAGLPATLAMQGRLSDAAGPVLARALYSAIGTGEPVEDAVWEARQALRSSGLDWAMPALWSATTSPVSAASLRRHADTPAAPSNLPFKRPATFVGRERTLAQIHGLFAERPERPVAICGMAGIGKTQIAVEYAHGTRDAYPGGVFWLDARDTARLLEEYAALGGLLGLHGQADDEEARARRARAALQTARLPALAVFDSITDSTDLSLLPAAGSARVLLTARDPSLVRPVSAIVEPPGLGADDAVRLLEEQAPARSDDDRRAMAEIAAIVDGLPLALALAAHHARRLGVGYAEYRDRLRRDTVETLEQARRRFVAATGHTGALFEVIEVARRDLPADATSLLELAACTAGRGADPALLSECLDWQASPDLQEVIADLVDAGLVYRDQAGRLSIHSLVRTCVLARTCVQARRRAIKRLAVALEGRLAAANRIMSWPAIRPDMPDVRRVLELAAAEPLPDAREALLFEYGLYLYEQGQSAAAAEALREGMRLCEARADGDRFRCAEYARRLAEATMRVGDCEESVSLARRALNAMEAALGGDAPELVEFCITMGLVLKMSGQADAALGHYVRALALCEAGADPDGRATATCLNNIGAVLEGQGRLTEALAYLGQALSTDERLCGPDHPRVAIRLNNIGRVRRRLGEPRAALDMHRRAIEINDDAHGPEQRDSAMSRLYAAEALLDLHRLEEAIVLIRSAAVTLAHTCGPAHSGTRRARALLAEIGEPAPC